MRTIYLVKYVTRINKKDFILEEIRKRFDVWKEIEEEKDMILVLENERFKYD